MIRGLLIAALSLWVSVAQAQMGQIPSYVTPPAATGCSQATTFLARTSGLSGTESGAYTTMICGMVTDGTITGNLSTTGCGTLFDAFYIFATNNTTTAALDICNNHNATVNGSPTFTADAGFTPTDGSSSQFINTGFNVGTGSPNFTLNSAHISCWILSSITTFFSCIGTRTAGGDDATIAPSFNGGNTIARINESDSTSAVPVTGAPLGWFVANRSGASASQIYRNGSLAASPNTTSTAIPTGINIYGLAQNSNGSSLGAAGYLQPMMTIGGSMNGTQAASVYSRVCTFLTTVHGSC